MTDAAVQLSIIVFLRVDGPIDKVLDALSAQPGLERAEVLVADGRETPGREDFSAGRPWLRHLKLPPQTMPALKAAAIREARGELIAILDPYDLPEPNWLAEIVASMSRTEAAAVGGEVLFGGPDTAANRAAYLFEYGAFTPPMQAGRTTGEMPGNNLVYRRRALLGDCGDLLSGGFWKPFFHERISARGGHFEINPAMRVRHATSYVLGPFAARRFQYGRCFGAMRRRGAPAATKLFYIATAPAVPLVLTWRHVRRAWSHPENRQAVPRAFFALVYICFAWGLGEWLGCWLGAGRSCEKVY